MQQQTACFITSHRTHDYYTRTNNLPNPIPSKNRISVVRRHCHRALEIQHTARDATLLDSKLRVPLSRADTRSLHLERGDPRAFSLVCTYDALSVDYTLDWRSSQGYIIKLVSGPVGLRTNRNSWNRNSWNLFGRTPRPKDILQMRNS